MAKLPEPLPGAPRETRPVLIVGAGPTGLTAALELSRFGIPVRLIDKLPAASTTSRALAVQARTLELFAQRGLTPEMLRLGNQGNAATIYGNRQRLGSVQLRQIPSRYNYILLLSQAETERLLREQVARQGVAIERSTELIAFEQVGTLGPGGGIKAVLRRPDGTLEELAAAYLISAEGAHSSVRHTLNLDFPGKSLGQHYALADLHLDGDLPDDELSIFLGEHGFLAVFPMGKRHFRFIATDPQAPAPGASAPTLAELQGLYDADAHIPARLRDMTWSSRFAINSRMLHTLREGRIFFGGDAAHVHSPAGGQGMNTGIQDMINLSWKLALVWQGHAASALLDTYQADRLPVISGVVTKTESATEVLNSDSSLVHQLVAHIAPVLLHTKFVQHLSTGLISEVTADYRASALSQTEHAGGHLRAGDRVPDLDVRVQTSAADGVEFREAPLYELLDPSRLTLLLVGPDSAAGLPPAWRQQLAPWQHLLTIQHITAAPTPADASRLFAQALGQAPGLLLVRPDAYVGLVAGLPQWLALLAWLSRWFSPAAS